jgi:hypothetical protein
MPLEIGGVRAPKSKGDVFTCAKCHGEFKTDWSDKEALAESRGLFGMVPMEELCIVCDDCWRELLHLPQGVQH